MNGSFDDETLRLLEETKEVRIETLREDGAPEHRTIVWVVVVDGVAFVRSVRGAAGRWYREISTNPEGALHVGDRRIPVRAFAAEDPRVDAVSEAIQYKYGEKWPGPTAGMVRGEVLATTLKLLPA